MNNFREWLGQSEDNMSEVQAWITGLESRIASSIRASEGYISVSISSLASFVAPIRASAATSPIMAPSEPTMSLAAAPSSWSGSGGHYNGDGTISQTPIPQHAQDVQNQIDAGSKRASDFWSRLRNKK